MVTDNDLFAAIADAVRREQNRKLVALVRNPRPSPAALKGADEWHERYRRRVGATLAALTVLKAHGIHP